MSDGLSATNMTTSKIDFPFVKMDFKKGDPKKKTMMATWDDTKSL